MAKGGLTLNGIPMPLDLQELQGLESRSRSGTWPLSEGEDTKHEQSESSVQTTVNIVTKPVDSTKRMRNPWGNMSYADLITEAILSSPEKRLTLSEIYDWIVHNVPYFNDKASSPSTAGWKNSVRHNLSLHSRFVKVQNETSGKSSWWTVNLEAKSTRGRRRSSSVDNGNAPSPRTKKREKKKQLKKNKAAGSSSDLQTSSPCDSPTMTQGFQPPWSPSPLVDQCPSPASSDRSATYSPVAFSPVLQRHSRNVTPVSPLVSPPGLDHSESMFSGSNSSLLDSFQENSLPGGGQDLNEQCIESMASLNLRSSRGEGMGSSSSLSSLNSPRLQQLKQPHVFNFPLPNVEPSSGYSSVSDSDQVQFDTFPGVLPPPYEDHMTPSNPPNPRMSCGTPTRHSHQLHISQAYDGRPRSGSEPASMHPIHHHNHHHNHHIPKDIDPNLFTSEFKDLNIQDILRTELQFGGLDFQMSSDGPLNTISPHSHTHYTQPSPNDPTLTSVVLENQIQVQRRLNPGW